MFGRKGWPRAKQTGRAGDLGRASTADFDPQRNDFGTMIRKAGEGDRQAFSALYNATSGQAFGAIERLLAHSNPDAAGHALQQTYAAVWQLANRFEQSGLSPLTWILTLAKSSAVRYSGQSAPPIAVPNTPDLLAEASQLEQLWPEYGLSEARRGDQNARLLRGLDQLDPDRADALALAYLSGQNYDDIAQTRGIKLDQVRAWLRVGIVRLDPFLGAQDGNGLEEGGPVSKGPESNGQVNMTEPSQAGIDQEVACISAEYALGLLTPTEEHAFEKAIEYDIGLRQNYARWAQSFAGILAIIEPQQPPVLARSELMSALFPDEKLSLLQRLGVVPAMLGGLAAALLVLGVADLEVPGWVPSTGLDSGSEIGADAEAAATTQTQLSAQIFAEASGALFAVQVSGQGHLVLTAQSNAPAQAEMLSLWLVPLTGDALRLGAVQLGEDADFTTDAALLAPGALLILRQPGPDGAQSAEQTGQNMVASGLLQ
ncbi:MAG: hypothetical protein JKX69_07245 [Rhodobacteraceae bacterium]|nr:hypothetical protein [Paracoccaceae bacterium]